MDPRRRDAGHRLLRDSNYDAAHSECQALRRRDVARRMGLCEDAQSMMRRRERRSSIRSASFKRLAVWSRPRSTQSALFCDGELCSPNGGYVGGESLGRIASFDHVA